MAIIKFELKENHIKLLKHLDWKINVDNVIENNKVNNGTPYGGLSLIEDAGLILFGKPEGVFDPLSLHERLYSEKQINEIEETYSELPLALEVILYLKTFDVGHYKKNWNQNNWREYKPKS